MRKKIKIVTTVFVLIIIVLFVLIYKNTKKGKNEKNGLDISSEFRSETMAEIEHEPKEHKFEGYLISDLNEADFEIINFNEKEKQIYQSAAVWKRKRDDKLFFRSVDYEELSNKFTEPLDVIGISSDKYEENMYLENKVWVDKVGVDAVYLAKFEKEKMIFELCQKNCDFDKYMVTDNFKNKFNEQDGILGDVEYDSIEYSKEYRDGGAYDLEYTSIITTSGKVKKEYKINYIPIGDFSKALDDIEIFSKRELTNEDGESVKLKMDEDNWLNCIERLAFSDDDEVGKSEKFIKEHPNFTGIFPNVISILPATKSAYNLEFDSDGSDISKKIIVCNLRFDLMYITQKIKISYSTDQNNYLDSFYIEELKKIIDKYEINNKHPINRNVIVRLLYNYNTNRLPITDELKNTNKVFQYFKDYDVIDVLTPHNDSKMALTIIDSKLQKRCFGLSFNIINNLIDDVTITPLDITEFPKGDAAFNLF